MRIILSLLVFLLGSSGLVYLYLYGPKLDSREVVVAAEYIGEHQIIQAAHLQMVRLPSQAIPNRAIRDPKEVIGKVAKGVLPAGAFIYPEWIEEDGFYPKDGEILLPINTSSIFAVNLSLRSKDKVYIAFFKRAQNQSVTQTAVETIDLDQIQIPIEKADDPFVLRDVKVAAVRSSSGNMVVDTQNGLSNNRLTTSETIGSIELIVTEYDAQIIKDKLEHDYTLWISRMK
jgi:hypothetical protein